MMSRIASGSSGEVMEMSDSLVHAATGARLYLSVSFALILMASCCVAGKVLHKRFSLGLSHVKCAGKSLTAARHAFETPRSDERAL